MESSESAVYRQTTWQDILDAADFPAELRSSLDVRSDGVWVVDAGHPDLNWHPLRELNDPVENDPRQKPHLPFPFSARDLAAFLIGTLGYFIQIRFGEWDDGPDEAILECLPGEAIAAKDAIRKAYQAYREALAEVGPLDTSHHLRLNELIAAKDAARASARLEIGQGRLAQPRNYKDAIDAARRQAIEAEAIWQGRMARWLLKSNSSTFAQQVGARALKRRGLVKELGDIWPTIEQDLKEASRNGLKAAAHAGKAGWRVDAARTWADNRGKLKKAGSLIPATPWSVLPNMS